MFVSIVGVLSAFVEKEGIFIVFIFCRLGFCWGFFRGRFGFFFGFSFSCYEYSDML